MSDEIDEKLREEMLLRELEARGLVVLPEGKSRPAFSGPRVPCRGRSASEMVIEDRR